jgi:hypothetical protein
MKWIARLCLFAALFVALFAATPCVAAEATSTEPGPSAVQFNIQLGFGHWYGATFGSPIGVTTPALTLGVRPGLKWLELRGYYSIAVRPLENLSTGLPTTVGFAAWDVALTHEIARDGQRMVMGCGPSAGFIHVDQGVGFSFGADIFARYMIRLGNVLAIGPFVDARAMLYELPGSSAPILLFEDYNLRYGHSDAQIQIGVAASLW